LGSISNFYDTRLPAWNTFGKQLPYVVMAMINFLLLVMLACSFFACR